jgi:hypothetical protein
MKFRRTLARGVALALLAAPLSLAAGVTPAARAADVPTHTAVATLELSGSGPITYKSTAHIYGAVKDTDGSSVYDGTVKLQALAYGASAWADVPGATDEASGFLSFDVKPLISTQYRLVYSGHTGTDEYDPTYTSAVSNAVAEPVARALIIKHKGLHMWGTIKPAAKLKLVFKIKKGKRYKKWFTVRTDKSGRWSKQIHGKVGTRFVVVLPASHGYAGAADGYTIY